MHRASRIARRTHIAAGLPTWTSGSRIVRFSGPGNNGFAAYTISWKTSVIEVARSGDLAYEHGRYAYVTREKDGKSKTQTGNYLLVWRYAPGGDWTIAVDTDTEDSPLAPPLPRLRPTK